jgi:hypothetical protein
MKEKDPKRTLKVTCTNLKMAKAGALSSEYRKPRMLSNWVLKQLSPRPNRKLQRMATSLLKKVKINLVHVVPIFARAS